MLSVSGGGVLTVTTLLHRNLRGRLSKPTTLRWFQIERGDGTKYTFKAKLVAFNSESAHDDAVSFTMDHGKQWWN